MKPEERRQADLERDRLLAVNVAIPFPSERRRLEVANPKLVDAIRLEATLAERERCAKIALAKGTLAGTKVEDCIAREIADAIRSENR